MVAAPGSVDGKDTKVMNQPITTERNSVTADYQSLKRKSLLVKPKTGYQGNTQQSKLERSQHISIRDIQGTAPPQKYPRHLSPIADE